MENEAPQSTPTDSVTEDDERPDIATEDDSPPANPGTPGLPVDSLTGSKMLLQTLLTCVEHATQSVRRESPGAFAARGELVRSRRAEVLAAVTAEAAAEYTSRVGPLDAATKHNLRAMIRVHLGFVKKLGK